MEFSNTLECLNKYADRVEDSRRVYGEEHRYEVFLKEGWTFTVDPYANRRYESFYTKRDMVREVRNAVRADERVIDIIGLIK